MTTTSTGGRLSGMPDPLFEQMRMPGRIAWMAGRCTWMLGTVMTPDSCTFTPGIVAVAPVIETPGGV